jgi:DNA-binding NtrC family response regulator
MPSAIGDKSAIVYAAELYRALAFGKSVANAHQCGLAALALHSMAGNMRDVDMAEAVLRTAPPELLVRIGIDASHVHIVQGALPTSPVPASSGESRIHLEIDIDADFETLDASTLSRLVSEICRLSGGRPVRILCVTKGSVRIFLRLDPDAARALLSRRHGGRLNQIGGLRVSNVVDLGEVEISAQALDHADVAEPPSDPRARFASVALEESAAPPAAAGVPDSITYPGLAVFESVKVIDTWQTAPSSGHSEQDSPELTQSSHLRMLTGACALTAYPVEMQGVSIGCEDCDVVIVDDPRISSKHARIERSFAGWQFQDLGSRNGFYVNGRGFGRGQRTPLPDGSVIRVGDSVMVFRAAPLPVDPRIDSLVFPGVSPEAAYVRRRIDKLADSFGHVLILGETATGKESVAKAIGAQRTPRPFVTLNCAQLNREMVRSELFGHVRGAFGAFGIVLSSRPGLVDLAGEGALFLDEIGDLPLDVQAELLRFLEDGSYRALGSTDLRRSSARVVAATNIDLDKAVNQGRFRRDLLARLRATNTPLSLPPLCERREDILGWTQLFFRLRGRDPGLRPWTAGALECLLLHPWAENLRELLAAVNFAAGQTSEFPCTRAHLPPQVRAHRSGLRMPADSRPDDPTPAPRMSPPPPEEDLPPRPDPSRDEIIEVLKQTRGRMRTTAQLLKIDRRQLYRLCKAYDINPDHYRGRDRPDPESD